MRGGDEILLEDLQRKQLQRPSQALVVFVVDTSTSMGEGSLVRMKAAKGAILGLLTTAYQHRDQVALISFREETAETVLPPTASVLLARQRLQRLPLGGATPLAAGLWQAWQLIARERRRQPGLQPLLVLVSDGEANVPLQRGAEVLPELWRLAGQLRREQFAGVVIDSDLGAFGSETLRSLAQHLGAGYRHLRELQAGRLLSVVRELERQG